MSNSFIHFNDNGFWAGDAFVEAFHLLLFEEIDNQYGNSIEWLSFYKKEIALQSLPLIYGGMSMCLDETIVDQDRKEILLILIENIKFRITTDINYLTGTHLNSLRRVVRRYLISESEFDWDEKEIEKQLNDGGYGEDLPTHRYIRAFDLLKQLVAGQINYKADSPVTYWD